MNEIEKELSIWRNYFIDELFATPPFKFIPEKDKELLKTYWHSIPSCEFTTPWNEWSKCMCALLQSKQTN